MLQVAAIVEAKTSDVFLVIWTVPSILVRAVVWLIITVLKRASKLP